MTTIIATDEMVRWFEGLDVDAQDAVDRGAEKLAAMGTALGFPASSAINGTTFGLRELRVQSNGRPLRVFYAFDPARDAVLLIGGDKTGDKGFYERMIKEATAIWKEYIRERKAGKHDE